MRLKRIARTLFAFAVMFAVCAFAGCPSPVDDPSYGDLSGGPQRNPSGPAPIPEDPDIVIYGVKIGNFTATEGVPAFTIEGAAAGAFFLGEEASAEDVKNLKISLEVIEGYSLNIKYAVTAPGVTPGAWTDFTSGTSILEGSIPSGNYLIFQITDESTGEISYYRYAITYGRNGVGLESITIAGRTFLITGTPALSNDGTAAPVYPTNVFLTAVQIAAYRPITVNLRQDSKLAVVTWAPSWVAANGDMPDAAFVDAPISTALADDNAIFIRVRSVYGDTYGNYRIRVNYTPQAVMGTLTVARASTSTLGNPSGAWNGTGITDGAPLSVKATRLLGAIASHSGGAQPGTVTWAFTPDRITEPEFLDLGEPQDLISGGYIYVRCQVALSASVSYLNVYRFPVAIKPLSADATLTSINFGGQTMPLGTPANSVATAVAGATTPVYLSQITQTTVAWAESDADTVIAYGVLKSGETTTAAFTPAIPGNIVDGDTLVIRVTSEDGNNILYYKVAISRLLSPDATLRYIKFGYSEAAMGTPAASESVAVAGSVDLYSDWTSTSTIGLGKDPAAVVRYALTTAEGASPAAWSATHPANASLVPNTWVWFEITSEDGSNKLYYKVRILSTKSGVYGRGTPDPEFVSKYPYFVFPNLGPYELLTDNIGSDGMPTKLPSVSYWSSVQTPAGAGHLHEFVDPFHFANGNRVTNISDWENRRKELRMIVGYYQKGFVPSLESDIVDVWLSGTDNTTINVRHKPSGRTVSANATVTAKAGATVTGHEGKLGIGTAVNVSDTNLVMTATAPNLTQANIMTLYGIPGGNNTVLTRDSIAAWNNSILLIAIEGTSDPVTAGGPRQATEQYYYPVPEGTHPYNDGGNGSWFTTKGPLTASGVSTGGKLAMHQIVLAHGRKPMTRAGFVNIGDSGSHGAMTEKMHYQAGLRLDVSAQEALRLSGFSEAYITQYLGGLPDNSAGLGPRQGHAATLLGTTRAPGFYNVNPDGTLKMGQYSVRGQTLDVRGSVPYGWQVSTMPDNAVGFSKRETAGSNGGIDDTWGVPWYHVGIRGATQTTNLSYGDGAGVLNPADRNQPIAYITTMFNGPDTGMPPYADAAGSNQVVRRTRLARGWSPYFEAFNAAPQSNSNTTMEFPLPNGENYIEVPYTAWFSMIDGQVNPNWVSGFGTWLEDQSVGTWNNTIFASFPANHSIVGFDYPGDNGGWACSVPTASYYQAMLDAPYGVQVQAFPTMQNRTNDYGGFATWLVVDEIYKMYGEAEGNGQPASNVPAGSGLYDGWDKYLYNNMMDCWWGNHAGMQGAATPSMTAARTRYLSAGNGVATTIDEAKADIKIARFRDPYYLVDDPYAYISDWHKMNISRPHPDGTPGTPISERVSRRVSPLLKDFFRGEIYHNAPARYGPNVSAITYHDAAKNAINSGQLTFTGPKYKPMDWRGLLDTPEVQQ